MCAWSSVLRKIHVFSIICFKRSYSLWILFLSAISLVNRIKFHFVFKPIHFTFVVCYFIVVWLVFNRHLMISYIVSKHQDLYTRCKNYSDSMFFNRKSRSKQKTCTSKCVWVDFPSHYTISDTKLPH